MAKRFKKYFKQALKKGKKLTKKTKTISKLAERKINKRPLTYFFGLLGLILALIILGNNLRKPPADEEKLETPLKEVEVYQIGTSPIITTFAKIEKSGVIKITAQAPGIISGINVFEGQKISRGKTLLNLSSNYLGANAFSLQRQLAQKQNQNILDTFEDQIDLINKQRDIADRADINSDELRAITNESLEDTRELISLNEEILSTLDFNINATTDPAAILSLKQLKSQFLLGTSQSRLALRTGEFTSDGEKTPAELSNRQKELAIKQLDLQEKNLKLSKEISGIQLKLALVNESLMYPAAPFNAVVERVHIRAGQTVAPGTELITLSEIEDPVTAVVKVPRNIAKSISLIEDADLYINSSVIKVRPGYISTEPTEGRLFTVVFNIPDIYENQLADGEIIQINIPIGTPNTAASIPFIPLDAVYQTQDEAFIFLAEKGIAKNRKITLGSIQGIYVEVIEGIGEGDQIILDRTVIEGEVITISD